MEYGTEDDAMGIIEKFREAKKGSRSKGDNQFKRRRGF